MTIHAAEELASGRIDRRQSLLYRRLRRFMLVVSFAGLGICIIAVAALTLLAGLSAHDPRGRLDLVWGKHGVMDGYLQKPRAIAIDSQDRLYLVDMTARIQVFSLDGQFLHAWRTPSSVNGNPSGLSIGLDGSLFVADTHYFQTLVYSPSGALDAKRTIGGRPGNKPGEFGFVTDAVQDSKGNYYIAEYGEFNRIQKFSPAGNFLCQWGGHGSEPGEFRRPQSLAIDQFDHLWIADACNHRIQEFDVSGEEPNLVQVWGKKGRELGQLRYPYDLVLDDTEHVYVCEFGNHRVQKFLRNGSPVASWGTAGRGEGELFNPWAIARDRHGRIHVVDTYNHRVQRIQL